MRTIFEYFEYREYLKDFYEDRKSRDSFFSYRYMAGKVALHSSHLIRIFQKKRHIVEASIKSFVDLCKLNEKESAYFEALVAFNKSRSDRQAKSSFERLLTISPMHARDLTAKQYALFQNWHHGAIRVLLSFLPFSDDYEDLARRMSPPITASQARKSVHLLEELGLITRKEDGTYGLTDQFVTTGAEWRSVATRQFQSETIRLAQESLERHAKETRDISTVTIAIARKDLPEIKERIAEFRKSLLNLAKTAPSYDEVYQLNVQLFPLTDNAGRRS